MLNYQSLVELRLDIIKKRIQSSLGYKMINKFKRQYLINCVSFKI